MKIERLKITNFMRFASREFNFHPQFNLIVGENASGKTSVLDALSIAVDVWFLGLRAAQTAGGIDPKQVHVEPHQFEDSVSFEPQFPARIGWEPMGFPWDHDGTESEPNHIVYWTLCK
jgi:hypothetical protein